MKIQVNTIEKQEKICEKFAEKWGISYSELMNEVDVEAQKEYDKLISKKDEDELSEDEMEAIKKQARLRGIMRARGKYKRQANQDNYIKNNGSVAFILFRFRRVDYNRYIYNKVMDYVAEHGEKEAFQNGIINNEGKPIHSAYTKSKFNLGKEIDPNQINDTAIVFVEKVKDGRKTYEAHVLGINDNGKFDEKGVPICQQVLLTYYDTTQPHAHLLPKVNRYLLNGVALQDSESNPVVSVNFANNIINLCEQFLDPTRLVDSFQELKSLSEKLIGDRFGYVGINATCTSIGQPNDPDDDIGCDFEFYSDEGDIDTIRVYVPPYMFKNTPIYEGLSGLLFLTDFYKSEKSLHGFGCSLGGFLPIGDEL